MHFIKADVEDTFPRRSGKEDSSDGDWHPIHDSSILFKDPH